MPQRYRPLLLVVALLVLFTALQLLVVRGGPPDPVRDHSVTRSNPWGLKALAEVARQHDLPVEQWDQSLDRLSSKQRFLAIVDPTLTPSDHELEALVKWVKGGGTLLLAVDLDQSHSTIWHDVKARPDAEVLGAFGLRGLPSGPPIATVQAATSQGPLREVKTVLVPGPYRLSALTALETKETKPLVWPQWQPLLSDDRGNILMQATVGAGRVYALSEAEVLSNRHLASADNVVLAANLLFEGRHDRVYFDERLHLLGARQAGDAAELPVARLNQTLRLVLAALAVYLVGRGWRFGAAQPVRERPRRSALEMVEALGDLYRRAGASGAIGALLRQSFRRRLATLAGTSPELPPEQLAAAVARRAPAEAARVQGLLERLDSLPERPRDEDLLGLAQQMAALEDALEHRLS